MSTTSNIKFTNSSNFTKKLKPNKCYMGSKASTKKGLSTYKKNKLALERMDELEEEYEDYYESNF